MMITFADIKKALSIAPKATRTMHSSPALNTDAPFPRCIPALPTDIIGTIFANIFGEGLDPFPMILREICRDWKTLIDSTSTLWSTMHIALSPLRLQDLDAGADHLDEWLTRAGSHTLRIVMTSTFDDDYLSYSTVHIVSKIMRVTPRIRAMRLDIPHYLAGLLVNNTSLMYSSLIDLEVLTRRELWEVNVASPVLRTIRIAQCPPRYPVSTAQVERPYSVLEFCSPSTIGSLRATTWMSSASGPLCSSKNKLVLSINSQNIYYEASYLGRPPGS